MVELVSIQWHVCTSARVRLHVHTGGMLPSVHAVHDLLHRCPSARAQDLTHTAHTHATAACFKLIARDRRMCVSCPFDEVISPTHFLKGVTHRPSAVGCSAAMSSLSEEPDLDADVAEPFRFHFEVAYEVANKGVYVRACVRVHKSWIW